MSTVMTFSEFLANMPPGQEQTVSDLLRIPVKIGPYYGPGQPPLPVLNIGAITVVCTEPQCDGTGIFECLEKPEDFPLNLNNNYFLLQFFCRNCFKGRKTIAIAFAHPPEGIGYGNVWKLGEDPAFGPAIPSRAISLVGSDRELFLKGRRCENQGLGVGAFAYYRRVIENQKNRLLDEIIKVAKRIGVVRKKIEQLETAKAETQFSRAMDLVKNALPSELLIKGHNPLTLLHSALSEGLHAFDDAQCLELATSVREVLFELAERIGQAMAEQVGLDAAVTRLHRKK